jgi:ferredoxin
LGMAPPSWLLAPLLLGASAVGVLACEGGCATGQDRVIAGRVAYCQEFLQMLGAPAAMVSLTPALHQAPRGTGHKVAVEAPFDSPATVLMHVARQYDAPPGAMLDHPYAPFGVVEIREDVCTGCSRCALACPTGALGWAQQEDGIALTFEAALCTACGQCLPTCPEAKDGAISLARRTDLARLGQGRTSLYRAELARCVACGAPIAPRTMLKRIAALLGSTYAATMPVLSRDCKDCRGIGWS